MTAEPLRMVRTSERSDFKRCPWLWHESWIKGLSPVREPTWAWFGTAVHKGLEARYPPGKKRGSVKKMLEAFEASMGETLARIYTEAPNSAPDETEVVDAKALGIAMLKGYVEEYGDDDEWECIHSEQPFQIDVPHPTKKGKTLAVYAGTWDGLWRSRHTKEFRLVDHKTRKSFPQNWTFYEINDQAGSYLWVAPEILRHLGIFGKKDRIEGLIFNCLKKSMPDTRPVGPDGTARNLPQKDDYLAALAKGAPDVEIPARATVAVLASLAGEAGVPVFGKPSLKQPAVRYHREMIHRSYIERVVQGQRVQGEVLAMNEMLSGRLPIWKTPTEDCTRCKLFDYCQVHENDPKEGAEFARHTLRIRDPYADHRTDFARNGVAVTAGEKRKHGKQ